MKRNIVTLLGVAAILVGIVFMRAAFEQSPKTDAEVLESEEAQAQLEEAAAITDEAAAEVATDTEEIVVAQADGAEAGAPSAETAAAIATLEEIAEWPATCPDVFRVKVDSTAGPYVIEVTKDWAPIGAERFYEMCKVGFLNDAGYFRVIDDFMVQFGLAADPKMTAQFKKNSLMDEPVRKSNQRGKITFAKSGAPNSRTTQVFINFKDNSFLDADGFAPFGEVVIGMDNVDRIYAGYGAQSNEQGAITDQGSAFLKANYPKLDYINKVTLVK